jgi:hypothetical protein
MTTLRSNVARAVGDRVARFDLEVARTCQAAGSEAGSNKDSPTAARRRTFAGEVIAYENDGEA